MKNYYLYIQIVFASFGGMFQISPFDWQLTKYWFDDESYVVHVGPFIFVVETLEGEFASLRIGTGIDQ